MSRHTSVAVEYSLFDRTASQDNAFSIDEIQPFSDTAELNDENRESKSGRRWKIQAF